MHRAPVMAATVFLACPGALLAQAPLPPLYGTVTPPPAMFVAPGACLDTKPSVVVVPAGRACATAARPSGQPPSPVKMTVAGRDDDYSGLQVLLRMALCVAVKGSC